jgi:sortase (surface protein transpeptidase)
MAVPMRHLEEVAARWVTTLAATASVVLGLGLIVLAADLWAGDVPPAASPAVTAAADDEAAAGATPLSLDDGQEPATLRIPAIEVEAEVIGLGLTEDGALEVPRGEVYDLPGWYVHGPRPGEPGPAVIGGHVDSRSGPSVFHLLGALEPGDEIEIAYEDGTVARFVVDRAEHHPKEAFPFDDVFGNTAGAELRLLTCGGAFDHGSRSYDDNLVVYAVLTGTA